MPATLPDVSVGLVGLEDIQDGGRGGITIRQTRPQEIESLKTRFVAGDILYGKLRPYLNKVGIAPQAGLCSTEIWAFGPSSLVDSRFAVFFLASSFFVDRVASLTKGANLPRLDTDAFDAIEIPLPPLSEQQRIVEILREAEEIRRLRVTAEARTAELIPAMFFHIFGDTGRQFASLPMGELVQEFRYGTSRSSGERGTTTLRIPNILGERISFEDLVMVDESDGSLERLRLRTGDLLFVRTNGNPDYVGRCSVFEESDAKSELGADAEVIFASYLIRARLTPGIVRPWFLHAFLRSPIGRARVLKQARTAAGQYNMNTEGLGTIRVPVPPLDLQDEFLAKAAEIQQIAEIIRLSDRQLAALGSSLSAHAFSGQLTRDWREAHEDRLALEARDRDDALKQAGAVVTRSRRATIQEQESIFEQRTDGIRAELNREQRGLLEAIDRMVGGVNYGRYFTAEQLAAYVEGPLHRHSQKIESHLAVFVVRGLIIPVSRPRADNVGPAFAACYRLPVHGKKPAKADDGAEATAGDDVRAAVMEAQRRLATGKS